MTCVLDEHGVAGTFDRAAFVPGFDLPLIADLKSGSSLDYSWPAFAIQLAIYTQANALYEQGAAADPDVPRPPPHRCKWWRPRR